MNAIRHLLREYEMGKLFNQFVEAGQEAYKQKQTIAEKVIGRAKPSREGDGGSRKTDEEVGSASSITLGTNKRHLSRYRLLSAWQVL